ncbi:MAG: hypothetical protein ACM3IK_04765 [Sphingomonadaceae bacterium]
MALDSHEVPPIPSREPDSGHREQRGREARRRWCRCNRAGDAAEKAGDGLECQLAA